MGHTVKGREEKKNFFQSTSAGLGDGVDRSWVSSMEPSSFVDSGGGFSALPSSFSFDIVESLATLSESGNISLNR